MNLEIFERNELPFDLLLFTKVIFSTNTKNTTLLAAEKPTFQVLKYQSIKAFSENKNKYTL